MSLIAVKARHNASHGDITIRRFLIEHGGQIYHVKADVLTPGLGGADNGFGDLSNITVHLLALTQEQAPVYARTQMKGRHLEYLVNEIGDVNNYAAYFPHLGGAFSRYLAGDTSVQEPEQQTLEHENTQIDDDYGLGEYGIRLNDADTASELNFSQCSGDTRADGKAGVYDAVEQEFPQEIKAYLADDEHEDINYDFQQVVYREEVGLRKAMELIQSDLFPPNVPKPTVEQLRAQRLQRLITQFNRMTEI